MAKHTQLEHCSSPHCSRDDLELLISEQLNEKEQQRVIAHLDECIECQRELERSAGSRADWSISHEALAESSDLPTIDTSDSSPKLAKQLDEASILSVVKLLAPSDDDRAAGRIGAFEVLGIVGNGGMGLVLKASEPALDRMVAIKLLSPHLASSQGARKRFAREARAAAAVHHENVIAIYQVAHWQDLPYLVMPYLPDPTLQQRIDQEGQLDIETVLSVALQIARGLDAAHRQGLVHRDVKPANILLADGTARAVITDFGLARAADDASLTRIGALTGTPHYMSPEQAAGEPIDQRSDLFSLGSVIYAMLAGHPPAVEEQASEVIARVAKGDLPSLSSSTEEFPVWIVALVDWLHRCNPSKRPGSANEVAELLEQLLAHVRQPSKVAIPTVLLNRPRRTWKKLAALCVAASICIGLVVSPLSSIWDATKRTNQPEEKLGASASSGQIHLAESSIELGKNKDIDTSEGRDGAAIENEPREEEGNAELQTTDMLPSTRIGNDRTLDWNAVTRELEDLEEAFDQLEDELMESLELPLP